MHCFRLHLSGLGGAVLRWLSQVALPAGGYFLTQHPKDMRFITRHPEDIVRHPKGTFIPYAVSIAVPTALAGKVFKPLGSRGALGGR